MTALIVLNAVAAALVVAGLAVTVRLGYLGAGGSFDRTIGRLELHRGSGSAPRASDSARRAA